MTLKECKKNICYCLNEKCTCKHNEVLKTSALFYRDEFAIGFAEWYLNLSKSDDWEKFDYNTNEKLLKMYKIEKRL
jgi:hypothetical protein